VLYQNRWTLQRAARATSFRRFTDTNVYETGSAKKYGKLVAKYPWIYGYFYSVSLHVFSQIHSTALRCHHRAHFPRFVYSKLWFLSRYVCMCVCVCVCVDFSETICGCWINISTRYTTLDGRRGPTDRVSTPRPHILQIIARRSVSQGNQGHNTHKNVAANIKRE